MARSIAAVASTDLAIASALAPDLVAEHIQDALDLVLLVELALPPAVVELDDLQRLDEERLAAGRGVVDDARQLRAGVGANRDDVAAIARGDDRVLEHRGVLAAGDERIEPVHQPAVRDADLAPDAAELRAGRVEHVAAGTDRAADVGFEVGKLRQVIDELGQMRESASRRPASAETRAAGCERRRACPAPAAARRAAGGRPSRRDRRARARRGRRRSSRPGTPSGDRPPRP